MFYFCNVLFLVDVLGVLIHEFTYEFHHETLKCDDRSGPGNVLEAHAVVRTAVAKLQNVVIHLGHCNYNINNFKKNRCYIVHYVKTRAKIF